MSFPVLRLRHRGAVTGLRGDVLVCASVGPADELVGVWTAPEDRQAVTATTVSAGGVSFPEPYAARPVAARITVHTPGLASVTPIADLALAYITVQPMPGERFLVIGARCRWRRDDPDRNAVLYDADGHIVGEYVLGDGITHVQATAAGEVWAGYFDEGIYGSYGWGRADSDDPVGASGIVRFSPALEPVWRYPHHSQTGQEAISDCSALNVDGTSAWACYDPGYPVVRIRDDMVTSWPNPGGGAWALAVAGSRVALATGSGLQHDLISVTQLGTGAEPVTGHRLVLPGGQRLPSGVQVIGRGPRLHYLTGTDWYHLDIADVP